jgi:hypothetical protein
MIAFLGTGLVDLLCWLIVLSIIAVLGYRSFVHSASRRELIIKWVVSAILILIMCVIASTKLVFKPLLILIPAWADVDVRHLQHPLPPLDRHL